MRIFANLHFFMFTYLFWYMGTAHILEVKHVYIFLCIQLPILTMYTYILYIYIHTCTHDLSLNDSAESLVCTVLLSRKSSKHWPLRRQTKCLARRPMVWNSFIEPSESSWARMLWEAFPLLACCKLYMRCTSLKGRLPNWVVEPDFRRFVFGVVQNAAISAMRFQCIWIGYRWVSLKKRYPVHLMVAHIVEDRYLVKMEE